MPKTDHPRPKPGLTDPIEYQGFYDFIADYIDQKKIIGSDPSMNYFGSMLLKVGVRGGYMASPLIPRSVISARLRPVFAWPSGPDQRVVVFSGDGGFQMSRPVPVHTNPLSLNPIHLVINNGVYGVEQWLANAGVFADEKEEFSKSCRMHTWEYSRLSVVFGGHCRCWKVRTYGELEHAMTCALANTRGPSLIEVLVPERSIPDNAKWKRKIGPPDETELIFPGVVGSPVF